MVNEPPDKEEVLKLRALWHACQLWRSLHKVRCAESIYQVDSVQEALPGLAEVVCNIVGYYEGGDHDQERAVQGH